jgi:hypothetical protein
MDQYVSNSVADSYQKQHLPDDARAALVAELQKKPPRLLSIDSKQPSPLDLQENDLERYAVTVTSTPPSEFSQQALPLWLLRVVDLSRSAGQTRLPLTQVATRIGWVSLINPSSPSAIAFLSTSVEGHHHVSHMLHGWVPTALASAIKAMSALSPKPDIGDAAFLWVPELRYEFLWHHLEDIDGDRLWLLSPKMKAKKSQLASRVITKLRKEAVLRSSKAFENKPLRTRAMPVSMQPLSSVASK